MQAAPASLACKENALNARKQRQGSQNNRHSLRNGLRLIRDLPGVPGLLASVTCRFVTRRLDASVGAPGPRDFAVRIAPRSSYRVQRVHRIPAPRVVTIGRNVPLAGAGWAKLIMVFRKTEAKYFCAEGLTLLLLKRSDAT